MAAAASFASLLRHGLVFAFVSAWRTRLLLTTADNKNDLHK
jgi:hypothetical protein